jgi:hypothetical protein
MDGLAGRLGNRFGIQCSPVSAGNGLDRAGSLFSGRDSPSGGEAGQYESLPTYGWQHDPDESRYTLAP